MIGATWNVRGLNKKGKLQCIADFISNNHLDFVGFQETKEESFEDSFLCSVNKYFVWHHLPAVGTAGGILVGLNSKTMEALAWRNTNSCVSVMIKNIADKFVWRYVCVYGSHYEEGKLDFIQELHEVIDSWYGPTLFGETLTWLLIVKKKAMA